jgi:hypothetical protein
VDDKQLSYTDLCATYDDYCYDNEILRLSDLIPSIESKDINLTYPIFFDPYTFQVCTDTIMVSRLSSLMDKERRTIAGKPGIYQGPLTKVRITQQ